MRKYLFAAAAAAAIATPAAARDGSGYFGIEGGILFPRSNDADTRVVFTTTQTPATPAAPAGPANRQFSDAFGIDYKRGADLDAIAGYDFGAFRLEAELGYKRAKLDDFNVDNAFVTALNTALNRPSAPPDPGAPGLAPLTGGSFDLDGRVRVLSLMANALLDFGNEDGLSFYGGGGVGRARVRMLGDRDSAWALQGIAGIRYALSPGMDIGLKYRYFRTGNLDIATNSAQAFAGNPDRFVVGTTNVDRTTNAQVFSDFEQKFRSHSLLASLIFNF
ncbi:MAG TPA: outer membrane beta-barrel protein, partial [Sphingomicrobium sp.]|nr:outer membrane beta-barrel protein [Sphingomicrobium sp.]